MSKDKRIDAYIAKSADFAKPILKHIRELVHEACPDVEETMKWSFPHFDYLGEMMCSVAAFKQHCAFNLWKAKLMKDASLIDNAKSEQSMGHLGRITSLKDLPSDKKMIGYIKEAMKLNEQGVKVAKPKPAKVQELAVPDYFLNALKKNKKAFTQFENFAPGQRKEYITWIIEAKQETTRDKRMAQAVEWIAEGKNRNWKYER